MLGPFVEAAGGINIADAVAPGPTSLHTEEFLLAAQPDVWIGTASGTRDEYIAGKSPVALGYLMTPQDSNQSLRTYINSSSLVGLTATDRGRVHAIWHGFYNSPLNIIALNYFAYWLHPSLFADRHPHELAEALAREFLPYDLTGVLGVSLGTE